MQGGAQVQAAAAGGGGNGQQQQRQQFSWRGMIFQLVMMYFLFSYLFGGNKQTTTVDPSTGKALPPHRPLWHGGERMQLRVFKFGE